MLSLNELRLIKVIIVMSYVILMSICGYFRWILKQSNLAFDFIISIEIWEVLVFYYYYVKWWLVFFYGTIIEYI